MLGARPAFVRGAKLVRGATGASSVVLLDDAILPKLLMIKLAGEPSYGIHERRIDRSGRRSFVVQRVDPLSPADRAGVAQGDELLTVQVLGIDKESYVWTDLALERLEGLEEINVIQMWVKKVHGTRITDGQQKHHDRISQMLGRAREFNVSRTYKQRPFIRRQLRRVVVGIYDKEMEYFGSLWKALPPVQRVGITLPIARDFVNTNRLPGLLPREQTPPVAQVAAPAQVAAAAATNEQRPEDTPPGSPTETDVDTTYSLPASSLPTTPMSELSEDKSNDIDELLRSSDESEAETLSLDKYLNSNRRLRRPKLTTERTKRARCFPPPRDERVGTEDPIDATEDMKAERS